MITYFHFISQNNVILSNVPRTLYSEIDKCKAENMFCTCPILKKTKRHGKKNTDSGFVYLCIYIWYLQPIITQYFIDNKSEIWLLFLIAHSKR